jgi:sialate O-acetylesterase
MVMQQLPSPTVVWGFAPPNTMVTVVRSVGSAGTPPSNPISGAADKEGVWRVSLLGRVAGNETFGFTASAAVGAGAGAGAAAATLAPIKLEDVVYGDVWVCSGQSNMAVVTGMVFNASIIISDAARYTTMEVNPLRVFAVNMSCALLSFGQNFALEDAIGSHMPGSLEARACVCPMAFLSGVDSSYRSAL